MIEIANGDRQIAMQRIERFTGGGNNTQASNNGAVSSTTMMFYIAAGIVLIVAVGFGVTFAVIKAAGISLKGSGST